MEYRINGMSPSEFEERLYEEPFTPLRVTLVSGDQVIVDNPRRAVIAGLSLVYAISDNAAARVGKRLKIMSIPNIVLLETIHPGDRRNGRRRR